MDEETIEEILYPLYLECQSLEGDERTDFLENILWIVQNGVDRWSPTVVESEYN